MAESDPERYRILSEFERMIRTGEALLSFGEIKRLGMTISKSFEPAKSRKDTISGLMALLAQMPRDETEETTQTVTEHAKSSDKGGSSYVRLAEYLISGTQDGVAVAGN